MCFDYSLRDGQSQACAGYPSSARLVSTEEALEDVGKVRSVDADPIVYDRDSQRVFALQPSSDHDVSAGLRVVKGVPEDIAQSLAHSCPIKVQVWKVIW